MTTSIGRLALGLLLAFQFVVFEWAVLAHGRFSSVPGGTALVAFVALIVYGAAIAFVVKRESKWRLAGILAVAVAVLFTARFHLPLVIAALRTPAAPPELVAFLRELSAAQEQYRLRHKTYTTSVASLRTLSPLPAEAHVRVVTHGGGGWAATVTLGDSECGIWARDSTLRSESWQPEGSPVCERGDRSAHQTVQSILGAEETEAGFRESDVSGQWLQHRADERRTAIGSTPDSATGGYHWTRTIGGELRASVGVAGNQVFIGAHGNGEMVALSLDSGTVGFRIRVPNWVHHEPAISSRLIVVGFGNSEPLFEGGPVIGSAPSGVAAYDRRTGVEQWRQSTKGAVMTSPVLRDSIVAAITYEGEVIAWRLGDGTELWRTRLDQAAPMANPLLRDSIMFVGLELARLCALNVRSGQLLYCRDAAANSWGGGHASPALAGDVILLSYHARQRVFWLKALLGLSEQTSRGEGMLAALDVATGAVRWRVSLGRGLHDVTGHIAGTPTVLGKVAYVPVPSSGRVVAIHTDSGRVIWSTEAKPARGSVLVTEGAVLSASADGEFLVLDAATGAIRCRQKLPARTDRAGLTLAGRTGILTLRNGMVLARPIGDWLACRAQN